MKNLGHHVEGLVAGGDSSLALPVDAQSSLLVVGASYWAASRRLRRTVNLFKSFHLIAGAYYFVLSLR